VVADIDLMINTLNGYRTFLAGEGWTAMAARMCCGLPS
jgi:hypothetical protein